MTEKSEMTPTNEANAIRNYVERLKALNGELIVRGIVEKDDTHMSRAWELIIKPKPENPAQTYNTLAVIDWDDTLESYTTRKELLYSAYLSLVPTLPVEKSQAFIKFCQALNKEARILPRNGEHPEHYSPLFELYGVAELIAQIQAGNEELLELAEGEEINVKARKFLRDKILPTLPGRLEIKQETKKDYFLESREQALAVNFSQKPTNIPDLLWNTFVSTMTLPNIPEKELDFFDLPDDVYFVVATFGEAAFQLEKIINTLEKLKAQGKKLPNEILVFTRGRKNVILQKLADQFPGMPMVYIDDSPRQVDEMIGLPNVFPVRALRPDAKRKDQNADPNIPVVQIGTMPLSAIIAENRSKKTHSS